MTFAPGHRLAYERDGSAVYRYIFDGSANHPPTSDWPLANNEADTGITVGPNSGMLAVVVPAPITIVGLYVATNNSATLEVQSSPDSTDGRDGAWTTRISGNVSRSVMATYRDSITALSVGGVRSIRARNLSTSATITLRALHIYVLAQETFLKIWHPTLDQEIHHGRLDWNVDPDTGNPVTVYAGETQPLRQIRVKNIRSQQANGVVIAPTTYTDQTPSINGAYSFSLNGTTWSATLNIGNIAAGAISSPVWVRFAPPANQPVSTYATQIAATPGSWT